MVGSRAHGLATPSSDFDYRGVFVVPTSELLSLDYKASNTQWIEGKEDDTSWELGHFLNLARHCNPTILEAFVAPVKEATEEGQALRDLFPHVWNANDVCNAFCGYGFNQRKKFLEEKDARSAKYAVAYLRVLYQAKILLLHQILPVDMSNTPVYNTLKRWKAWTQDQIDYGEVIGTCKEMEVDVRDAFKNHPNNPNLDLTKVNDFLLKVRQSNW